MNLVTAFAQSARQHAEKAAVFWGDEEISYAALSQRATEVQQALTESFQVAPGDRVAIWCRNSPEFASAFLGILMSRAAVVPVNVFLKPDEVAQILDDAGIRAVVLDSSLEEIHRAVSSLRPEIKFVFVDRIARQTAPATTASFVDSPVSADSLAVIVYTSGTTGHPKGAMLSHGNLLHNIESCREVLRAVDHDRFVVLLPMFHSFMMTVGMLLPLLVGGSLVIIRSLHPPKNVVEEILRRKATILPAVPQFFRTLAAATLPHDWPLRLCISGGAPLPREILREFNARMPIPLIEGYGLSEASPVVSLNPIQGPIKEGSIGVPVPGVQLSVRDDQGKVLGIGETGELCVRGGNVMLGYWNRPEETSRAIQDGWLLTGDLGHQDAEGFFFITDRKKDMLIVNGINVYPREIEELLYRYPGVKEAAVIGAPDARRGELPIAFLAPQEGAVVDEKSLLQYLRERLADYKVPRRVIFLPALPRNATGKVLKTALRAQPLHS